MLSEDDDIDLEDIEVRLYSQVYHSMAEETPIIASEIQESIPIQTRGTKYSWSNTGAGYTKQSRYYGNVSNINIQQNVPLFSNVSNITSTTSDIHLSPNIIKQQSLTIKLPSQNTPNTNDSQNSQPGNFYGHNMGQISFPQFYSVINPTVNNIVVLQQKPTEYLGPLTLNKAQRKKARREAIREEINKIKAASENAELFKNLSLTERKKVYKYQKRQNYLERKKERKKMKKEQQFIDIHNLCQSAPKNSPRKTNYLREIICLSDSDPEELKLIEQEYDSYVIISEDESLEEAPNELCTAVHDKSDEVAPVTIKIESKITEHPLNSCAINSDDDIIFVEPKKVEIIVLDMEPEEIRKLPSDLETESVSSSVSLNSSADLKLKEVPQTTPKSQRTIIKDRELLSTPESASNDFLDASVVLNTSTFNFNLHGSDYSGSTEFLKPKSLAGVYESESSCSASDMSTPVKQIVFNEIEFEAPAKELFLDNNLESFSQFITPKRTNILPAIPSILSSNVDEFEAINSKVASTSEGKTASDSSSESEYEENKLVLKKKKNLPNLTPFDTTTYEVLKTKKRFDEDSIYCEKVKKKKHGSDTSEVEVTKKKKKSRNEVSIQEETFEEVERSLRKKKKIKSSDLVEERVVQNEEIGKKELKKKRRIMKDDIPNTDEEIVTKDSKKKRKNKIEESIMNSENDPEGTKSPKEPKKKKDNINEDFQSVAEDEISEEKTPKKRKKTKSEQSETGTSETGSTTKSKKKKKRDKKDESNDDSICEHMGNDDEKSQTEADEVVTEEQPKKSRRKKKDKSEEQTDNTSWVEESTNGNISLMETNKEASISETDNSKIAKTKMNDDSERIVIEKSLELNVENKVCNEEEKCQNINPDTDDDDVIFVESSINEFVVIDETNSDIEDVIQPIEKENLIPLSSSSNSLEKTNTDLTLPNISIELCTRSTNHAFGSRFADFWSEDMDKFYNTTWGQENFNIPDVQRKMTGDPSKWKIVERDRIRIHQYTPKGLRCRRCRRFGHTFSNCDKKNDPFKCQLCGNSGHLEPRCPNKLCTQCGRRSRYYTTFCSQCAYLRNHKCIICQKAGHKKEYCPDLWRRYHLTTLDDPLLMPFTHLRRKESYSMHVCSAKTGHLEDTYIGRTHYSAESYFVKSSTLRKSSASYNSFNVYLIPTDSFSIAVDRLRQSDVHIFKHATLDISKSFATSLTEHIPSLLNNLLDSQIVKQRNAIHETPAAQLSLLIIRDMSKVLLNKNSNSIQQISISQKVTPAHPTSTIQIINQLISPYLSNLSFSFSDIQQIKLFFTDRKYICEVFSANTYNRIMHASKFINTTAKLSCLQSNCDITDVLNTEVIGIVVNIDISKLNLTEKRNYLQIMEHKPSSSFLSITNVNSKKADLDRKQVSSDKIAALTDPAFCKPRNLELSTIMPKAISNRIEVFKETDLKNTPAKTSNESNSLSTLNNHKGMNTIDSISIIEQVMVFDSFLDKGQTSLDKSTVLGNSQVLLLQHKTIPISTDKSSQKELIPNNIKPKQAKITNKSLLTLSCDSVNNNDNNSRTTINDVALKTVQNSGEELDTALLTLEQRKSQKACTTSDKNVTINTSTTNVLPSTASPSLNQKSQSKMKLKKCDPVGLPKVDEKGKKLPNKVEVILTEYETLHFLHSFKAKKLITNLRNALHARLTVNELNKNVPPTGSIEIKGMPNNVHSAKERLSRYLIDLAEVGDPKPAPEQIKLMDKVHKHLDLIDKIDMTPEFALEKLKVCIALNKHEEIDQCFIDINTILYGKYELGEGRRYVSTLRSVLNFESTTLSTLKINNYIIRTDFALDYVFFKQRKVELYENILTSNSKYIIAKMQLFAKRNLNVNKSKKQQSKYCKENANKSALQTIPSSLVRDINSSCIKTLEYELKIQPAPWQFVQTSLIHPYFLKQFSEVSSNNVTILAQHLHFLSLSSFPVSREIDSNVLPNTTNTKNKAQLSAKVHPPAILQCKPNSIVSVQKNNRNSISKKSVIRSSVLTETVVSMLAQNAHTDEVAKVDTKNNSAQANIKFSGISNSSINKSKSVSISETFSKGLNSNANLNIGIGKVSTITNIAKRKRQCSNIPKQNKRKRANEYEQVYLNDIQAEYIFKSVEGKCLLIDLYENLNVEVYWSSQFNYANVDGPDHQAIFSAKSAIQEYAKGIKCRGFPLETKEVYDQLISQFAKANVYYLTIDCWELYYEISELEHSISEYTNNTHTRLPSYSENNLNLLSEKWSQLHSIILVRLAPNNIIDGLSAHLNRLLFWKDNILGPRVEVNFATLRDIKDSFYIIFDCNRKQIDYAYCNNIVRGNKIIPNIPISQLVVQYIHIKLKEYLYLCRQYNFGQKLMELSMFTDYVQDGTAFLNTKKYQEALAFLDQVDVYLKEQGIYGPLSR